MKKIIGLSALLAIIPVASSWAFSSSNAYVSSNDYRRPVCPAGYTCTPILVHPSVPPVPTGAPAIPPAVPVIRSCYAFSRNLGIGSIGDDVKNLTTFLVAQGFLNSPSATYDETVASGVTGFQQRYSADILAPNGLRNGTGYFGPSTRIKLNQLNACAANPVTPALTSSNQYVPATPPAPVLPSAAPTSSEDHLVTFTKTFNANPQGLASPVTLSIAADNGYQATLNGSAVASKMRYDDFSHLASYDVTSAIAAGANTLQIVVTNLRQGSDPNFGDNPGGLIYKLADASGNVLAVSDSSNNFSSSAGSGPAFILNSVSTYQSWDRVPGANWIWDVQPGVNNLIPGAPAGLVSINWNNFGLMYADTYLNPRVNFGNGDYAPYNDTVTAAEWCKHVAGKSYVSGTSQVNWTNPQDGIRYGFDGSKWVMHNGGDYPRAYVCSTVN